MQEEDWQPLLPPGVLLGTYSSGANRRRCICVTGLEAFSSPGFARWCFETVFGASSGLAALGGNARMMPVYPSARRPCSRAGGQHPHTREMGVFQGQTSIPW